MVGEGGLEDENNMNGVKGRKEDAQRGLEREKDERGRRGREGEAKQVWLR